MGNQEKRGKYNYKHSRSRSRDRDKDRKRRDRSRDRKYQKEKERRRRRDSGDSYSEREKVRQKQIRLSKLRALKLEEELSENKQSKQQAEKHTELEANFIQEMEHKREEQVKEQEHQAQQPQTPPPQEIIKVASPVAEEQPPPEDLEHNILMQMNRQQPEQEEQTNIFAMMRQPSVPTLLLPPTQSLMEEEDPLDTYMRELEKDVVKQEQFKIYTQDNKTFIKSAEQEDKQENQEMLEDQYNNEMDQAMVISQEQIELQIATQQNTQQGEYYQEFIKAIQQKQKEEKEEAARKREEEKNQLREAQLKTTDLISDDEDGYYMEEVVQLDEDAIGKEARKQEKKELKVLDHNTINYKPFRKYFYIECDEIKNKSEAQVELQRELLGGLKVRGKDCPRPIDNWHQCGLNTRVLARLKKKQFREPFAIQSQCIPAIMSGRDVIGIAETGSGKTLAYILPMLRHILDQRRLEEDEGMIGLVMAPTRELCNQIHLECKSFCSSVGLRVGCVYGGAGVAGQLSQLKKGAEIVVCTPGRMIDILCLSNGKITNLKRVTFVVLDEADRMFDMGFEPQIAKILNNVRPDRQTVMFSATFPRNVENLAKRILQRPVEVVVGTRGAVCANVGQQVEVRQESTKFYRLLEILGEYAEKGKVLVFVDKQSEADLLFRELLKHSYLCLVLHGGQDQVDREFTIQDFKKGLRTVMIATSVCARGLDIKDLVLVVNFKCPNHIEDYIHRIGRTGRAGQKGVAITFITPSEEQYAYEIIKALQVNNQPVSPDLADLAASFRAKVAKGEAKVFMNRNLNGQGFKFDVTERKKLRSFKQAMKKQFGYEYQLSEDEGEEGVDDIVKSKAEKDLEDRLQREKKIMENQMNKDPALKKIAMENARKTANSCIQQGFSSEQVLKEAHEAIKKTILDYRPNAQTVEKGLAEAVKIRDELLNSAPSLIQGEKMTAEVEINDFPPAVRAKMISKDFLSNIYDLTGCQVSVRGIFTDPTKKSIQGAKKLYLFIEGEDKYAVTSAYNEVKGTLAQANMHASSLQYNQTPM